MLQPSINSSPSSADEKQHQLNNELAIAAIVLGQLCTKEEGALWLTPSEAATRGFFNVPANHATVN